MTKQEIATLRSTVQEHLQKQREERKKFDTLQLTKEFFANYVKENKDRWNGAKDVTLTPA